MDHTLGQVRGGTICHQRDCNIWSLKWVWDPGSIIMAHAHIYVCLSFGHPRMELNHTSNTAFDPDNYDKDHKSHSMPDGWIKYIKGHVCYDPLKVGKGFWATN